MAKRGNRSRNRRSGKNVKTGKNQNRQGGNRKKGRSIPFDPEKHFLPDPVPERDYDPCVVSGEEIDDIYTAIADPATGKPARFDKVVERISGSEDLAEGERVAYIGRGVFGIVKMERDENDRPRLVVRKRIEYEHSGDNQDWRKELSPGISRDYVPHPRPLSELYTPEELRQFPRFDSPTTSFPGRGN